MNGTPKLHARARGKSVGCVSELPTHNLRELIFEVFPLV